MTVIDDFIKKIDVTKRIELNRLRKIGKQVVPDAEEVMAYGMPTLKYKGKGFLGFNALANHIGIYPFSPQVIKDLKDELKDYELSKGAIRVPLGKPIPESLLKQIISHRLKEIDPSK